MAGILGLGLAYAGTADESVAEYLSPFVADDSAGASMEVRLLVWWKPVRDGVTSP